MVRQERWRRRLGRRKDSEESNDNTGGEDNGGQKYYDETLESVSAESSLFGNAIKIIFASLQVTDCRIHYGRNKNEKKSLR